MKSQVTLSTYALGEQRAKEMGLKIIGECYYPAGAIHKLFGEGLVNTSCPSGTGLLWGSERVPEDTHQGLLVGIRPIKRLDTSDSLLKEFVESWFEKDIRGNLFSDIAERAKLFLEEN